MCRGIPSAPNFRVLTKQKMVEEKVVVGQMQEKVGFFSCLSEVGLLKKPLG